MSSRTMGMSALALSTLLAASTARAEGPSATLPLDEVLKLYRDKDRRDVDEDPPPPVRASVSKMEMSGRLLDGALEITAAFEVSVLGDGWTRVRLFDKDARTSIARLPAVEHVTFAVEREALVMIADKPGTYRFEVAIRKVAQPRAAKRHVELACADAALAVLRLRFDDNLFRVSGAAVSDADGVVLYPEAGRFVVEWERAPGAVATSSARAQRPPIEPVVGAAHASVVSTLDGRTATRVLYDLRLEGTRPFAITLPEGQTLERVFLNGVAVPVTPAGRLVHVDVAPARAGDEEARLELVLSTRPEGYFLSGSREYAFPEVSWNVNELFVALSLPQVFNYTWTGGSLATTEHVPDVEWAQTLPTPGKSVFLRQQLVSGSANVRIAYDVDLEGSYYKGP